ncbi:hypothetical protein BDV93DRAFT_534727 [Ceratobasidium sp. AG-I]|nr:hypothetical protein BDV93DRAFT_534727 [Ceratobasidium sp. AG-I]
MTQASQKLPGTWQNDCLDMGMRLTWHIGVHRVPPDLVINADQTGVSYLGTGNKTWELRGAKQVLAIGCGEKRQFTVMVAITASGMMLPWQAIFKGKSNVSLPSESSRRKCEDLEFIFTPGGDKHWSTLECMKQWIELIIVPHIERQCQRLGLPATQRAVILLDCWSVH